MEHPLRASQGAERRPWPAGDGEMATSIRDFDWTTTPIGPIASWPASLRVLVDFALGAAHPVYLGWGPEVISLYNDATIPYLPHPRALGCPFRAVWPEVWDVFRPRVEATMRGEAQAFTDQPTPILGRPGYPVSYLTSTWTPVRDDSGDVAGFVASSLDTTQRKLADDALRDSEWGLRVALEAGRMGTYRFDVHTGVEQWSDSEYELLGLTPTGEPPTRELFLSIVHPDDLHLVEYTENDQRPAGTALDSEFRIIRPDTGEVRHLTAHALARFGPDGKPAELVGVNQDVTEERRAQSALRSSEERLQRFSEASTDVLWIRSASTLQWEYLSPGFDRIYGLTRQDALKADNLHTWLGFIVPEDRDGARAALMRVGTGERVAFEYRIRRPDGEIRWLRNTDFPIRDQAGIVTHIAGVGSDITFEKTATEHQRLLLNELQHRVRNSLSVIRLIARRSSGETAEDYQASFLGRLDAFARVQSAVTHNPGAGLDLATLIAEELGAFSAKEGDTLRLTGPDVALEPRAAERLGLAVHELATNAMKYGALSEPSGRLQVSWSLTPERLALVWHEHGLSGLDKPTYRGFGTEVIDRTLAYDLGAITHLEFLPTGVRCEISLPRLGIVK